jgi:cytochrome P450
VFFGTDEASVAYIDGTAHRRRRAQLHPAFNGGRDYAELILEVLDRRVASWPRGTTFPLFRELQKLTSEVITRIVCGHLSTVDRQELAEILLRTEDARCTRDDLIAADRDSRAFIQDHLENYPTGPGDVFATLRKLAHDGDATLTDDVIRDEVFGLLYTGFSTTANTLAWAFVEILDNPRVHDKLTGEIGDSPITREALNELPYLEATLKETLRLHPVTPLNGVRLLHHDLEIDGHLIPAGSILVHCAYLLQRSPDVYPDPLAFQPERFLDTPTDPYTWGAFGGGHRMCVGRGFSMNEMKVVLARLLTSHHLERLNPPPKARQQGFFLAPADDAEVILR